MGTPRETEQQLLFMAVFSRYKEALAWAREKASARWGEISLISECFPFEFTKYYQAEMGQGLMLQFLAFEKLIAPSSIVSFKLETNALEQSYAREAGHTEFRPLNLDPGYLTANKLVLASTKDASHRIYLDQGIYAEVTLSYAHSNWHEQNWTYQSYREESCQVFLTKCRQFLLNKRTKA